jgi:hypothetical protein
MVYVQLKSVPCKDLCRRGAVLLLLLIAVAILALLYVIQMDALFRPVVPGAQRTAVHKPWLEEDLIVPGDKLIKPPRPPKPAISEPLTLSARVRMDGNDRGTATIEFAVSGEAKGVWYSEYSNEDRDYTMEATFAGNIDIDKTYSTGEIVDKSRLYFITKGTYKQTAYNAEAGTKTLDEGLVYVTGWLNTDYSVNGLITITTDKTWSAVYTMETEN